jgi:hypothetical protein
MQAIVTNTNLFPAARAHAQGQDLAVKTHLSPESGNTQPELQTTKAVLPPKKPNNGFHFHFCYASPYFCFDNRKELHLYS